MKSNRKQPPANVPVKQCDHCDGAIEKQSIYADGDLYYFYECQECGCQWDTNGYRMTLGKHEACQNQWVAIQQRTQGRLARVPRKTWIVLAIVAALVLLPFTGSILLAASVRLLVLLRVLIIPIAILAIAYFLYRRWKQNEQP